MRLIVCNASLNSYTGKLTCYYAMQIIIWKIRNDIFGFIHISLEVNNVLLIACQYAFMVIKSKKYHAVIII